MLSDPQSQYEAIQRREERLDGSLLTAVKTTGAYCRPSCRAKTPRTENVDFHPTAANRPARWIPSLQALLPRRQRPRPDQRLASRRSSGVLERSSETAWSIAVGSTVWCISWGDRSVMSTQPLLEQADADTAALVRAPRMGRDEAPGQGIGSWFDCRPTRSLALIDLRAARSRRDQPDHDETGSINGSARRTAAKGTI